jgi:RHS repeat-associated protein
VTLATPVIRYQLNNHLGSACLELDRDGAVISYEEYYPYGSTSYQAGHSVAEVSLKRYRYTGKERDEETGLSYHGARYYAPWLGRWISSDPDPNQFSSTFVAFSNSPVNQIDLNGGQDKPWWQRAAETAVATVIPGASLALQVVSNPQEFKQKAESAVKTGSQILEGMRQYYEETRPTLGKLVKSIFTQEHPMSLVIPPGGLPETEIREANPITRAIDRSKIAQEALARGDIATATKETLHARDSVNEVAETLGSLLTMTSERSVGRVSGGGSMRPRMKPKGSLLPQARQATQTASTARSATKAATASKPEPLGEGTSIQIPPSSSKPYEWNMLGRGNSN